MLRLASLTCLGGSGRGAAASCQAGLVSHLALPEAGVPCLQSSLSVSLVLQDGQMGLCTRCCWRWGARSPVAFSTFASRVNQGMSDGWMSILRCTCVSSKPFCLVSEEIDLEESQELQHSCSEISSYLYKVPYLCLTGLL